MIARCTRRLGVLASLLSLAVLAATAACERPRRLSEIGDDPVAAAQGTTPAPSGMGAAAPTVPSPAPAASGAVDLHVAPLSFAPIAHRVDPSVVMITTVEQQAEVSPFTGRVSSHESQGLGTGFVIDKSGIILTNNHVVGDADSIVVKLSDERVFPGKVVATDRPTDVAVLRIDAKDLLALPLGDSDVLEVGDWVVAVGNPYGLSHTVSAGIVSAKGRTRDDVPLDPAGQYDFLQTDASINPGNSGGPLLNLRGEVVGINTAVNREAQGIGFAIPINMVKQLLPMLLRDGHMTRSALGVRIGDARQLTPEDRRKLGLPGDVRLRGAIVGDVIAAGPADKAGIHPGDLIEGFEGQTIDRASQVSWLASTTGVGRTVTLRVQRGTQHLDLKVTLGRLDAPVSNPR